MACLEAFLVGVGGGLFFWAAVEEVHGQLTFWEVAMFLTFPPLFGFIATVVTFQASLLPLGFVTMYGTLAMTTLFPSLMFACKRHKESDEKPVFQKELDVMLVLPHYFAVLCQGFCFIVPFAYMIFFEKANGYTDQDRVGVGFHQQNYQLTRHLDDAFDIGGDFNRGNWSSFCMPGPNCA